MSVEKNEKTKNYMNFIYRNFLKEILKGTINFQSNSFKAMLLNDLFTPSNDNSFEDIQSFEISEQLNYAKGGKVIAFTPASKNDDDLLYLTASGLSWAEISGTVGYVLIYKEGDPNMPAISLQLDSVKELDNSRLDITFENGYCFSIGV